MQIEFLIAFFKKIYNIKVTTNLNNLLSWMFMNLSYKLVSCFGTLKFLLTLHTD